MFLNFVIKVIRFRNSYDFYIVMKGWEKFWYFWRIIFLRIYVDVGEVREGILIGRYVFIYVFFVVFFWYNIFFVCGKFKGVYLVIIVNNKKNYLYIYDLKIEFSIDFWW